MYELLTGGERPFTGEMATVTGSTGEKVRWELINIRPSGVRLYNPQASVEVEAVVAKCLEKEAGKRYGDVLELLTALNQAMGKPVKTPEPQPEPKPILKPVPPVPVVSVASVPSRTAKVWLPWLGIGILAVALLIGPDIQGSHDHGRCH